MTYALLIYRCAPASEPLPQAVDKAALAGHRALQKEAAKKGDLHAVTRLDDARAGRTVRAKASGHEVSDGPFIEAKEWLVGFYVVDCESFDEALERAKMLCPDPSHAVEVRPVTWQWKP